MLDLILGGLWPYVLAAGGAIAALVASYAKGRKDASDKAAHKAAQSEIDIRKRLDAENYLDSDTDRVRERMRARGEQKRPVRRD